MSGQCVCLGWTFPQDVYVRLREGIAPDAVRVSFTCPQCGREYNVTIDASTIIGHEPEKPSTGHA